MIFEAISNFSKPSNDIVTVWIHFHNTCKALKGRIMMSVLYL